METERFMQENKWLSVEQVAARLDINVETVRRWIRRGELPAMKVGGRTGYRIEERDLQEFIKKKKTEKKERPAA
jgi:excisionase family DNA binding protein